MSDIDEAGRVIHARADYDRRMTQARARARWELGDPSWASVIVAAFLYPDTDAADMKEIAT